MAKRKPGEKRVQLSFQRPEDLRLFEFMEKQAYEARYELSTFIIVALQKAFEGQVDEAEIDAVTQEALRKVRERAETHTVQFVNTSTGETSDPSPVAPLPTLTPELEESIRAKIAGRTTRKSSAADKGNPTPPPMPQ